MTAEFGPMRCPRETRCCHCRRMCGIGVAGRVPWEAGAEKSPKAGGLTVVAGLPSAVSGVAPFEDEGPGGGGGSSRPGMAIRSRV